MRSIISALFLVISTGSAFAQGGDPIELVPDAPDRHIVAPGDTLWGISNTFLKDPFRWPEVWRLNADEVKNPHRIYPGQVIVLDRSGAQPQLRLGKLIKVEPQIYSEEVKKEIPAIPQNVIEPFLSEPMIVEEDTLRGAPRVVAIEESRVNAGAGYKIYAKGIVSPSAKLWQIYRPGRALTDPVTQEVLGHEAIYVGSARIVTDGQPADSSETALAATLEVVSNKLEVSRGDSLMPAAKPEVISYMPHSPTAAIKGNIVSIYGGVGEAGKYAIVTVSKGKADGIERGHVLAIYRAGGAVANRFDGAFKAESIRLPDERYGLLFIFRVFDRVSYALVMDVSRPVSAGDVVQKP
jgi:hypothetical protein